MISLKERWNILITKVKISLIPGGAQALKDIDLRGVRYVHLIQHENKELRIQRKTYEFDLSTERGRNRYAASTRLAGMRPVGHHEHHTILDAQRQVVTEIDFTKTHNSK